jgi:hypothetical protein
MLYKKLCCRHQETVWNTKQASNIIMYPTKNSIIALYT